MGSAEERQAEREEGMAQNEEAQAETSWTLIGPAGLTVKSCHILGIEKAYPRHYWFANFVGDFAKTKLGMVEEDDEWNNTDHKDYRGSERDLVIAEPRSMAGQMARDLVSFVVIKATGGLTGLSKAAQGARPG